MFHSAACLVFLLCSVMRVAATDLRLRHVYHWGEPQSSSSRLGSPHLSRLGAHARDTNDGDTHARTLARRDLEAADTTMAMLQLADHLRARVRASHAATTRDTSQTSGATAATVESIVAEVLPSGSGSGDDDAGFSEEDASAIASADDYAPVLRVQTTTSTDDGTSAQRLVNIYEDQYTPLIRHSGSPPRDVHGNAADKILLPNLALRSTVLALALASSNAYTLPDRPDWMDMDHWGQKNVSFGWDADGLRGHVFASKDGDVLLVAFKGTTPFILGKGGPSSERDRLNVGRLGAMHPRRCSH